MKNVLLLLPLLTLLHGAEPSAFGAGDLSSPSPYGLTEHEKLLLENKKNVEKLKHKDSSLRSQISDLKDSVSGLQSLIEGLNQAAKGFRQENQKLNQQLLEYTTQTSPKVEKNSAELLSLQESYKTNYDKLVADFNKHNENINVVLRELSDIIDTINQNYASKAELNKVIVELNEFRNLVSSEFKNIQTSFKKEKAKASRTGRAVHKDAIALFKKKAYKSAIKEFELSITKAHKPATSNFYMAESYYFLKDYKSAIYHYKTSLDLYKKANYMPPAMPKILYHAAISFSKIKDKENSQKFFKVLSLQYPDTKEGKEALKYLPKEEPAEEVIQEAQADTSESTPKQDTTQ